MKVFHRILCLFMAALLTISLLPFRGALAGDYPGNLFGGQFLDGTDAILASIAYEDQILVLTRKAFYHYQAGNAGAIYICQANSVSQEYPDDRPAVDALFMHQDKIMGLNTRTGWVYTVAIRQDAVDLQPVMKLKWDQIRVGEPPEDYLPFAEFVMAYEGRLYIKLSSEGQPNDLFSFSLETGDLTAHAVTCLHSLTPYRDGLFLAAHFDPETSETGFPEIVLFDPVQDTMESTAYLSLEEGLYGQIPLYYDAEQDCLYAAAKSALYCWKQNEQPAAADDFPTLDFEFSSVITPVLLALPRGGLMVATSANVFMSDAGRNRRRETVTLSVAGSLPDKAAAAKALLELGGVTLVELEPPEDAALRAGLLTGSSQIDILALDSSSIDVQSIVKKGYLQSLSASGSIAAFSEDLLPGLKSLVIDHNEVYAVPAAVSVSLPAVNLDAFEAVQAAPPHTLPELMELTQRYADVIYPEHPEMKLFSFAYIQRRLKEFACSLYINAKLAEGADFSCDAAELGVILKRIDDLDLDALDLPREIDPDEEAFYLVDTDSSAVLMMELNAEYSLSETGMNSLFSPLPLLLSADGEACARGSAILLAAPVAGAHREKAIQFIEAYLKYADQGTKAMLCPSAAVPVLDPHYEEKVQEQAELVVLNRQLAAQSEGDRRFLYLEMAEVFQRNLDVLQEKGGYCITRRQLDLNKAVMEKTVFDDSLSLALRGALFADYSLLDRLLDGAVTAEQFASEANHKAAIVCLEMR